MNKINEKIQVVNENDEPVGGATKPEVWEKGLYHRIVRVIIDDPNGDILLQKRDPGMQLWPNCWDNSASGHVDEGEDYDTAAKRELKEELSLERATLEEVAYYQTHGNFEWRKLNRFVKIYRTTLMAGEQVSPEVGEVTETAMFSPQAIGNMISGHPDQVTDGLEEIYDRVIK